MLHSPEQGPRNPKEVIFKDYGIYTVTKDSALPWEEAKTEERSARDSVTILSQPDWKNTKRILEHTAFGASTVLTPELITVAGVPFSDIPQQKGFITKELEGVRQLSEDYPDTTYVVGTPFFLDGVGKPYNTAVTYRSGRIATVSFKKMLDAQERDTFSFSPAMPISSIDDMSILVCRDFIGAQKTRLAGGKNGVAQYMQRATNDADLAKQYENMEFLQSETKRVLLSACWGVGIQPEAARIFKGEGSIDAYYLMNLRVLATGLLRMDPDLNQVIVCDRAPLGDETNVATKPMSGVFFK